MDHGRTLGELKRFSKPNLDDGNRFYDDNKMLVTSFSHTAITADKPTYLGFYPKSKKKQRGHFSCTRGDHGRP